MAYLSDLGYEHDVFVSYAHVDDDPLEGAELGWVTTLIDNLEKMLARKLGRRVADIWKDYRLAGNEPVTAAILENLSKSATVLVVLSPGFLESEWCRRETNSFLGFVKDKFRESSRLFVVECARLDENDRPTEFKDLKGYRFWFQPPGRMTPRVLGLPRPDPTDESGKLYYDRLGDLSHELATELKQLKAGSKNQKRLPSRTIYLAEVTDDLDPFRDELGRYLEQSDVYCLPDRRYPRDDPEDYKRELHKDLAKSSLFVQLLSEFPGKLRPPELPRGYLGLQFDEAKSLGLPILRWRKKELDLDSINDPLHRAMLGSETVQAVSIEEFKRAVRDFKPPDAEPATPRLGALVFVDAEKNDLALAREICNVLEEHGGGYVLPLSTGEPSEIRKDLEANLVECDALIILYGEASVAWVREQMMQCRKALAKRSTMLQALAIYMGPPTDKPPVDIKLPGVELRVLDCRAGFQRASLASFLDKLGDKEE